MNVQRAVLISCPATTNRRTYGKPRVEIRTVPLSKNGKHPSLGHCFMVQIFSTASLHAQRIQKCFCYGFDKGLWSFRAAYRAGAPGAALKGM